LPLAPATTNGSIALENLNGQIEGLERGVAAGREPVAGLVEMLALRGQLLGRIADYESAETAAEAAVRARASDPSAYLARARSRLVFHRFEDARHDLDAAERLKGDAEAIAAARASALQGAGDYEAALAMRKAAAVARPSVLTLGNEAALLAERGDVDAAEPLFDAALRAYRDVSPFPVCWLDYQRGMMWLRAGDLERARSLFGAVVARLPGHAAAATNLGWLELALGHRERGMALLRGVVQASDDPEAAGILAQALPFAGQAAEAERYRKQAAARYDELVARHPEAYADHAARFWLGPGQDPQKAFVLAERNLGNRKTPTAYALMVQAALATRDSDAACTAAKAAVAFGRPAPPDRPLAERALAERALASCPAAKGS
jgi:tetratricopeptide (TPR) repeat protein